MLPKMMIKRMWRVCVIGWMLMAITACGVFAPRGSAPDVPSLSYFDQEYYASPDNMALQSMARYLGWVEQFYQGSLLQAQGWLDVVNSCVASVPDDQKVEVEAAASGLGRRIAAEWAKDNSIRKITTRHVSVWGLALREAINKGDLLNLFKRVGRDVDALISGQLEAYVVNSDRYYEPEYNEFF